MQNYSAKCRIRNAECRIIMQNQKCRICCEHIRHICKNAELVHNRTECRIRTKQNRKQNEKIANGIQNQNKTEFNSELIRTEQQYEQNSKLDQNRIGNIQEFRITTEQNEKTANSK